MHAEQAMARDQLMDLDLVTMRLEGQLFASQIVLSGLAVVAIGYLTLYKIDAMPRDIRNLSTVAGILFIYALYATTRSILVAKTEIRKGHILREVLLETMLHEKHRLDDTKFC